jgi:hypothetical protein
VLAQLSGQGRLAVGAILGAATAALFLVGITTGPDTVVGRAELPLAMTDVPGTSGTSQIGVPAGGNTMTAVVSATVTTATTTSTTQPTTTTSTGPTSVPVPTSGTPPTTTTAPPPPTTTRKPTRTRRPPPPPPCFLFC